MYKAIHIFPHSGSQIPVEFLDREISINDLDIAVQANRDVGFEKIIEELLKSKINKVFYYPYSRVFCDINRLKIEHITPDEIFTGHRVPRLSLTEKQSIVKKYVYPYQEQILKTVQENPNAYVFHWHSMDTFNRGTHTVLQSNTESSMRPIMQIFNRVDCYKKEFSSFFNISDLPELVESNLLSNDMINKFRELFSTTLINNALYKNQLKITIDDPYVVCGIHDGRQVSMPMLVNYIHIATNEPIDKHIAFDIRKDCLNEKSQFEILKIIIDFINKKNQS